MSKNDRSSRHVRESDRYDRSAADRYERDSRKTRDRDTQRRRRRSPSYDSSSDSSDYDSDSTRDPSPRRPSRRHTTAYSDSEDHNRGRDRRRRERQYESEDSSPERRSIVEDLLSAVGLIQSKKKGSRNGEKSRSLDDEERRQSTKAAVQAALTAAAMEAFRTRKEGKLTPQRLMQIAGAAIAAGGLDALIDRDPSKDGGSLKHLMESVVAGLATGKTMGSTIKHKRDRNIGDKVGSGMIGMATKQILSRSMSRGPDRDKRRSKTNRF